MTIAEYTRYTLRLPITAPPPPSAGPPAAPPADDWSGAPSPGTPERLDYAHPEAAALLTELQPDGWQEAEGGDTLVFWLQAGAQEQDDVADLLGRLSALGELTAESEAAGWEDGWRAFHHPQLIGRLYVRPPWYPAEEGFLDLVVETGMAFGTGGHATTRQCLEEIQTLRPGSLLDIGSGSGIVALAARRLGFGPVWGIDNDPQAVFAAADNAALNGLGGAEFLAGDATDQAVPLPATDTVVANIALAPILRLARRSLGGAGQAPALASRHLILAGLLIEQGEEAAAAFPAYRVAANRDDGTWIMLHLKRLP